MAVDAGTTARTCVVVLNWNQPGLTRRCLDHLAALTGPPADVVVIDNGSTPDNRAQLERECGGRCRLMLLPANLGFAGGMNRGIDHALATGYEYVWLLNNDAFPEPDCLTKLVAAMDHDPGVYAASPRLTDEHGSPQCLGARIDLETGRQYFIDRFQGIDAADRRTTLIGAALLVRASGLRAIGGFDEQFFAYREDDDLCLRLYQELDAGLVVVEDATCIHLEGSSTGGKKSQFICHMVARNGWLLLSKLPAPSGRLAQRLRYTATVLYDAGHDAKNNRPDLAVSRLTGLRSASVGRYGFPTELKRHTVLSRALLVSPFYTARLVRIVASLIGGRRGDCYQ